MYQRLQLDSLKGVCIAVHEEDLEDVLSIIDNGRVMAEVFGERVNAGELAVVRASYDLGYMFGLSTTASALHGRLAERLPEPNFKDVSIHPAKSLMYLNAGLFYLGVDTIDSDERQVFQTSVEYFQELFLLQAALVFEEERTGRASSDVADDLRKAFLRLAAYCPAKVALQSHTESSMYERLDPGDYQ